MGHNWFGDMDLAWKYSFVFGGALVVTFIMGFIKVFINSRNLARHMKKQDEEAAQRVNIPEDMTEKMRVKDEGDLFGIRAIEAGFYGGVAQSTPVSQAASPNGSRSGSPEPPKRGHRNPGRARIHAYNPSAHPPPSVLAGHASALRQMRDFTPRINSPSASTLSFDSAKSDKTIISH